MGQTNYKFKVKTKDQYLAGTDSNIFVRLYGERGISNEIRTNPYISGNAFERNKLDEFTIPFDKDCGDIYKIEIRSDMMYSGADWLCEYFKVKKENSDNETYFNVDTWINKKNQVYPFLATSGYVVDLPEATQNFTVFKGMKHFIPPNVEMKISCLTTWKASVNYSEVDIKEIKTGAKVEAEYLAVKASIETELKTSIERQCGQTLDMEMSRQTEITVPPGETARVLMEIWTEQDLSFNAKLGADYYGFSLPNNRTFSGFEEVPGANVESIMNVL